MTGQPVISVVLPCYNAEHYIREAMESILQQSHRNLELIVIDDGSTDDSLSVMQSIAAGDNRIKIISRENRGLIASLNEGIAVARGEYIARMDADDISLPDRLARQLSYLQQRQLDLVGGAIVRFFPASGKPDKLKSYPETHDELVACLLTMKSRIAHPTVLARKAVFDCYRYDPQYKYAEDYALWLQIALDGRFRLGNMPEPVLRYRSHENQVTSKNRRDNKQAKKLAFFTMVRPLCTNAVSLESLYELWQGKSLWRRWRGALQLQRWFAGLAQQRFFNAQIQKHLVRRALEQLF